MSGFVLITGAASGIGLACAIDLAGRGIRVFAGARDERERESIEDRKIDGVTALQLDVTRTDEIEAAAKRIRQDTRGEKALGVINSAGLVVAGPLEFLPADDLQLQFDVNVLGLMAVTRTMLPLLRPDKGRVIQVGSVGGRLTFPFTGAYCASKAAVRLLADSLRMELRPSGVRVSLIEPGPIDTPIWERSLAAALEREDRLGPDALRYYGDAFEGVKATTRKTARGAIPVERVVDAVRHALLARRPRPYYLVGASARLQAFLARWLPPSLRDPLLRKIMGL